jgi:hypothetical protein
VLSSTKFASRGIGYTKILRKTIFLSIKGQKSSRGGGLKASLLQKAYRKLLVLSAFFLIATM